MPAFANRTSSRPFSRWIWPKRRSRSAWFETPPPTPVTLFPISLTADASSGSRRPVMNTYARLRRQTAPPPLAQSRYWHPLRARSCRRAFPCRRASGVTALRSVSDDGVGAAPDEPADRRSLPQVGDDRLPASRVSLRLQTVATRHPIPYRCINILSMHLHAYRLPRPQPGGRMVQMVPQATGVMDGREPGLLSACVCSTRRRGSRAVTQVYDDSLRPSGLRVTQFSILATIARSGEANLRQLEAALAIDQTTLTRRLNLLERDRVIERVPHPDGRVKAMRLTRKGRRVLDVARPLWAHAQDKVLGELGTSAWND